MSFYKARDNSFVKQIWRGFIGASPVMMGYFPIGFAFGVLAANAGITPGSAAAMSLFVYAGSGQLIAVSLIDSGVRLITLTITVFLINLRHLLMSAYIAPFLGHLQRWQQAFFCFEMTDEVFAVHSNAMRKNDIAPPAQLMSLNMFAHSSWIISGFLGAWIGNRMTVDTDVFGLDYALPAMFIALLVVMITDCRRALIALFAAFVSVALYMYGMGQWYIIVATMVAATAGSLTEKKAG